MVSGILRATFGRLSTTAGSLGRITIGHIQLEGTLLVTVLSRHNRDYESGKTGQHSIRLMPIRDEFIKIRLREDRELIELTLAMIEGGVI